MTHQPTIVSAVTTVGSIVRGGVSYLTDLLGRLVRRGMQAMLPMMVAAGCSSESVDAAVTPPPVQEPARIVVERTVEDEEPKPIGQFSITFYYMIGEDEVGARSAAKARALADAPATATSSDDPVGELAAIAVPELVTIYEGGTCKPISEVSKEFAAQLALQGTGKLKDGRVINIWGHCNCEASPCFKVTSAQWGTAGNGRRLQPYRTVAVDPKVIKLGSLLYVPLLEGRTMPGRAPWGGFVHDGCVVADDVGGGIKDKQLDLFVGRKRHYLGLSGSAGSHAWARHVPVFDGSKICERKGRQVARRAGAI